MATSQGISHSQRGGSAGLVDAAGADMGYRVELAGSHAADLVQTTQLSVIDTKADKTVAYTWSDPDSELIGINAGWIRIGVKLAKRSAGFALPQKQEPALVSVVADYLEGRFSSAEQANEDPNFRAISLKTCRIPLPALGKTSVRRTSTRKQSHPALPTASLPAHAAPRRAG